MNHRALGRLMPGWWRPLLAVVLIPTITVAVCMANADSPVPGILANGVDFRLDLDDDLDEMLRHFMLQVTVAAGVDTVVPTPRPQHLSRGLAGPGPTSWPGRTPAGRAPPATPARHAIRPTPIETSAAAVSATRLQLFPTALGSNTCAMA